MIKGNTWTSVGETTLGNMANRMLSICKGESDTFSHAAIGQGLLDPTFRKKNGYLSFAALCRLLSVDLQLRN